MRAPLSVVLLSFVVSGAIPQEHTRRAFSLSFTIFSKAPKHAAVTAAVAAVRLSDTTRSSSNDTFLASVMNAIHQDIFLGRRLSD